MLLLLGDKPLILEHLGVNIPQPGSQPPPGIVGLPELISACASTLITLELSSAPSSDVAKSVTASIAGCSRLTSLRLEAGGFLWPESVGGPIEGGGGRRLLGFPSLTRLDLRGTSISDLMPLCAAAPQLLHLDLSGSSALSDIRPLTLLTALRTLVLGGCEALQGIKPLSELTMLSVLVLKDLPALQEPGSIETLRNLTLLHQLDLTGCPWLTDLSPITACKALKVLLASRASFVDPQRLADVLSACTAIEV